MSLQTRVTDLAVRIATEFNTVRTEIANAGGGDLLASNNLSELTNIVTARLNLQVYSTSEVDAAIAASPSGDLVAANNLSDVADAATSRTNLNVYSQAEVDAAVAAVTLASLGGLTEAQVDARAQVAIDALVDGAPGALDTLNEIAAALQDNPSVITDILAAQANRLRFDAAQTLNAAQQLQGQTNLNVVSATDIGNTDANFVTTFEGALA